MTAPGIVIIGAGQAGCEAAFALRQYGVDADITLIGDEAYLPYRRPPLSKAFVSSTQAPESTFIKPLAAFAKAGIGIELSVTADKIDRRHRQVVLSDGRSLAYSQLILATGGRARQLPLPGADRANVFRLRSLNDALKLRPYFKPEQRLVVIGGGYIGLEIAALARHNSMAVSVLEAAPRLLARVAQPLLAKFLADVHRQAGVDVRLQAQVLGLVGNAERVEAVRCADGAIAADLVLLSVGLQANSELAAAAGLSVDDGVLVNLRQQTSDPTIYAIGDCARAEHGFLGGQRHLESVPNAIEQGRRVAQVIAGQPLADPSAPWFWSDQYDLKLQMVGLSAGFDQQIVRGDPASRSFLAIYLQHGRVIAIDAVNRAQDFAAAKTIVNQRRSIDPERLGDDQQPLAALLA
ncbi:MAG: pyridine nucleotide-disulfide oxidoreductase [Lysobacterales bacterium CG02_land_8_20_14_3_00_62_12]|nr:MAG: pyridine nucleotide-disulfide oxidoreductase [Xanthomonadales bacterium CG02_land_8_20_14_3_00_62_12]